MASFQKTYIYYISIGAVVIFYTKGPRSQGKEVMSRKKCAIVYIDGFNFYNGLIDKGLSKFKWIDYFSLSQKITPNAYEPVLVRYFTTRIKGDIDKHNRQHKFLISLEAHLGEKINIQFGRFQVFPSHCKYCKASPVYCENCSSEYKKPNEKKTDVNIATMMLVDCIEEKPDCVLLISGDSDYETMLIEVHRIFPKIYRVIAFPPKRRNSRMFNCCEEHFDITKADIETSLLPNPVVNPNNGREYFMPSEWS